MLIGRSRTTGNTSRCGKATVFAGGVRGPFRLGREDMGMSEYQWLTVEEVNAVECSEGPVKREDYLAIASDWLMMQPELKRLREIDTILRVDYRGHKLTARDWRALAEFLRERSADWPVRTCNAIADVLEKPK